MSKERMIEEMAGRCDLTKELAAEVYDAVLESVTGALAGGESVALRGFGTFKTVERKARTGRNPATGETLAIPATRAARFIPGADLREMAAIMNKGWGADWLDFKAFQRKISGQLAEVRETLRTRGLDKDKAGEIYEESMKRFKEISFNGGLAWKELQKGFAEAFSELKSAFAKARGRF